MGMIACIDHKACYEGHEGDSGKKGKAKTRPLSKGSQKKCFDICNP